MPTDPQALVFDAYGTLFDVHSVTRLADSLFPGRGAALSQAWRTKQLEYTWLRSLMGRYDSFNAVTADSLDWALESLGRVAGAKERAALSQAYRTLAAFPEVRGALVRLGSRRPLAILSNGHPDMLDAVVDHYELRVFFGDRVYSVHEAGVFKPDPSVYALACAGLEHAIRITATDTTAKPFENHQERTVTGQYAPVEPEVTTSWYRVPMTQPLARLAFYLLEPRSNDGLLTWNVVDEAIKGGVYPILRTRE